MSISDCIAFAGTGLGKEAGLGWVILFLVHGNSFIFVNLPRMFG